MLNFVAIDFETANGKRDSACAVGLVKVVDSQIVARQYRLINPHTWFLPRFIQEIHGIGPDDVKDAPAFDGVWPELLPLLDEADFLVAHNAAFDRDVLASCCRRYGLSPPRHRFVCTLQVARKHWGFKPASLNVVCGHLGIELNHHQALSDALACCGILLRATQEGYRAMG